MVVLEWGVVVAEIGGRGGRQQTLELGGNGLV